MWKIDARVGASSECLGRIRAGIRPESIGLQQCRSVQEREDRWAGGGEDGNGGGWGVLRNKQVSTSHQSSISSYQCIFHSRTTHPQGATGTCDLPGSNSFR